MHGAVDVRFDSGGRVRDLVFRLGHIRRFLSVAGEGVSTPRAPFHSLRLWWFDRDNGPADGRGARKRVPLRASTGLDGRAAAEVRGREARIRARIGDPFRPAKGL